MSVGVYSWSTTASSNGSADDNINFAENQSPASLNNSARALMAAAKAWADALGGGITYGGTGNAYTATNNAVGAWSAYASGQVIALKPNATNTGAATINVDGLGAKSIKTNDGGDVASGDLVSGGIYLLAYDGTNFQVLNTIAGGSYQPLDATLTALAALSWSSGNALVQFTAADTVSLTLAPSVTSVTANNGAGATTPAATFVNTTDNATVLGLRVDGDRATPAANDRVYIGMFLSDSAGNQTEMARVIAYAAAVADGSEDGRLELATFASGSMTTRLQLSASTLRPVTNDAVGLGLGTVSFSDLFLASGGVINWANGTFTLTQSGANLTPSGGISVATSSESTGALTSTSRNRLVVCSGNITLPASGMSAGDLILIDPGGTARTITRPAAHTMYVRDTDSATATTRAHNLVLAAFHGSSKWSLQGIP